MNIQKQIYDKMTEEKLSFPEMALLMEPPISSGLLRYHIRQYCKENNLPFPTVKRGRKNKNLEFRIKS